MKVDVVIGANFGDEGKGLMVDYLCRNDPELETIVVRFNGGGQAGHTVELDTGERRVFKHVGSGTFTGAPTYLSEHFLYNPTDLIAEIADLDATYPNMEPVSVMVHPDAKIVTPFDLMMNWAIENHRNANSNAHGSCGMGIGQTEMRATTAPHTTLRIRDIRSYSTMVCALFEIRDKYYKPIIERMGLSEYVDESMFDNSVIYDFINTCLSSLQIVAVVDYNIIKSHPHVVFEGAQGLLLDHEHKWFPHVTHSSTGLTNVNDVLDAITTPDQLVNVHYMTRSYLTRHGNGPLPYEVNGPIYQNISDQTNITNHYQGKLRFAPFNIELLQESILADARRTQYKLHTNLVVTCFNQLDDVVSCVSEHGELCRVASSVFLRMLSTFNITNSVTISNTPTAQGMVTIK